ncbi:hypothetical protein D3C81_565890 [compost metagenome]
MDAERGAALLPGGGDQPGLGGLVGLAEKGQGQMQIDFGHRQTGPGALLAPGDQGGGKLVQGQGKEESGHAQRRSSWYSHERTILWQLIG